MTDTDSTTTYPNVLVRSEQSSGRIGVIESVMPAGAAGPPLHVHDFDEAFYVLEGELTFHLDGNLVTVAAGQLAFAAGGEPHTFTNLGAAPARFLIACTPAGFEREFATPRRAQSGRRLPGVGAPGNPDRHPSRTADRRERRVRTIGATPSNAPVLNETIGG